MGQRSIRPAEGTRVFVTDGGVETDLMFRRGVDLPHFAAVVLVDTAEGRSALRDYTGNTSPSRRRVDVRFSWRALPGAPTRTGVSSSVTTPAISRG